MLLLSRSQNTCLWMRAPIIIIILSSVRLPLAFVLLRSFASFCVLWRSLAFVGVLWPTSRRPLLHRCVRCVRCPVCAPSTTIATLEQFKQLASLTRTHKHSCSQQIERWAHHDDEHDRRANSVRVCMGDQWELMSLLVVS